MSDSLLDIAADWTFRERPLSPSVPRRVGWPVQRSPSLAWVVQGVRRCGKSPLLQQLVGHYGLVPVRCLFLNLEDPRLTGALDHSTLEALVTAFSARHEPLRGGGAVRHGRELPGPARGARLARLRARRPRAVIFAPVVLHCPSFDRQEPRAGASTKAATPPTPRRPRRRQRGGSRSPRRSPRPRPRPSASPRSCRPGPTRSGAAGSCPAPAARPRAPTPRRSRPTHRPARPPR